MDLRCSNNINECPICGMDKGKVVYKHLFDVHGYTKQQIEDLKIERKHQRAMGTGKPVLYCEYCGDPFTNVKALQMHQRQKHNEYCALPTISCPICSEEVKNHRELARHAHRVIFWNHSWTRYLREQGEVVLASYMENSWSDRVDQWAAFGRLGSCVSTSMLCERFHKTLKHDILGGKANVRIDSLIQLLIGLTVETEEEREVMMERGVEEGRYRLQQHHKSHATAESKYKGQQHRIVVVGDGHWEVEDNNKIYHVQEHYCPCDAKFNNHCLRGECKACPYAFACNCTMDVKSGISCVHVHAALLHASSGRRPADSDGEAADSQAGLTNVNISDEQHSSGEEEEMVEITIEDMEVESEEVSARRRSTDLRDYFRDSIQKLEMMDIITISI